MKILALPGDGIGPEITDATLAVPDRANAKFKLGTRAFAGHVASLMG
jgi:isocitrate/isopropylmalate dehydrogenase